LTTARSVAGDGNSANVVAAHRVRDEQDHAARGVDRPISALAIGAGTDHRESSENLSRSNAHAVQVFNIDGLIDPHARAISWRRGTVWVGNIAQFCA
jgi:hypothetical protein